MKNIKNTNIYNKIRLLCDRNNLTIAELERKANIGNGTIRHWGGSAPAVDKMQRVASILGVTIDFLINSDNDIDDEEIYLIAKNLKKLSVEKRKLINELIKAIS